MFPLPLALPLVALLVLGAHFLRAGQWLGVITCTALLGLLMLRRAWVWRVLQAALVLAALQWLWTAAELAQQRAAFGRPWGRMAAILAVMALLSLAAAALLRGRRLRRHFGAG